MAKHLAYLITGANRGIGLGLAEAFLARPHTTVIAAVRDPNATTTDSPSLPHLKLPETSNLIVIKIDSLDENDPRAAIAHLQSEHAVSKIDIVIANAGIVTGLNTALRTSAQEMRAHFDVNAMAPLMLFQASWPLLRVAERPMFFVVSSSVGSIEQMEPVPGLAYGVSKAAVNFVVRKLHFEHEGLVSVAVHPGWVRTGMGRFAAEAPLTVGESVEGVVNVIDHATRAETSGKFLSYDGTAIAW